MIEVYSWATPNGHKIHVMLEECGLAYRAIPVDIGAGEQFTPEFLAIMLGVRPEGVSDAATALAVAPSVSAPSYSADPNTWSSSASVTATGPQHELPCSATRRAAAAYFSRTVSRMSASAAASAVSLV